MLLPRTANVDTPLVKASGSVAATSVTSPTRSVRPTVMFSCSSKPVHQSASFFAKGPFNASSVIAVPASPGGMSIQLKST